MTKKNLCYGDSKVNGIDGVHPLPDRYKILGEAVADKVRMMNL
jgi:lysophospholipase L1-like esterase